MRHSKAFTLIELLVVIAIVGVLLAVLVPALQVAKAVATGAVCMANLSGLNKTWYLYQEDNDTWLVGLSNYTGTPYRWVEYPLFTDVYGSPPVPSQAECNLEYQLKGVRAGKLYPYTGTEKLYHCPNDKYYKTRNYGPWISYSGSGLMNSEDYTARTGMNITGFRSVVPPGGQARPLTCVNKFNQIKIPANRFTFVEEDYVIHDQWRYLGGFVTMGGSQYWNWWDWPAWYHNNRSTLGFADGHAEKHDWRDPRTIQICRYGNNVARGGISENQPNNEDLVYVNNGYVPAGW